MSHFLPNNSVVGTKHSNHYPKFSVQLWGLDWKTILPITLINSNTKLCSIDFDQYENVIIKKYCEESPMILDKNPVRANYYNLQADFISFEKNGETIGGFCGNPIDWNTYYLRHVVIFKDYRGQGIYQEFLGLMISILQVVKKISFFQVDVAPDNFRHKAILEKFLFTKVAHFDESPWGILERMERKL